MCVFRQPSPPPLPEPRPTAPKPEQTARRVVVGQQRTSVNRPSSSTGSISRRRTQSRRLGTSSLRIPLRSMGTGNLNY